MNELDKPGSLRAAVISGARWKLFGQIATQGSRVIVTLVLAHLLLPRDFGLAGMVLIFGGLIQVFGDFGFTAGLISYKDITEDDRSTAFWVNGFVGCVLTCIGVAVAHFVARIYGEPMLQPLLIVLSLSSAITGFGSSQASLLSRDMRFRELELIGGAAAVGGAIVAVVAAFCGVGPWALILQAIATCTLTTLLISLTVRSKPKLVISRSSLRKLWGFGANVFGSRLFGYLGRSSDNFLVGRFLGAHALGIYSMAYTVIAMPFDRLVAPIQALLYPMFARLQDDRARTRDAWLQGIRMCLCLMAPLTVGAAVVAPDFIRVVLGTRWLPATHVLQVLAYVACIQATIALTPLVLAGQFRTKLLLRITTAAFVVHLLGFVIGLHWGVLGVAVGYAISNTVVAVPLQLAAPARVLGASLRDIVGAVAGVVEAVLGMAAMALLTRVGLHALGVSAPLRLGMVIGIGAVTFLVLIVWREPRLLGEFSVPERVASSLHLRVPRERLSSPSIDGIGS